MQKLATGSICLIFICCYFYLFAFGRSIYRNPSSGSLAMSETGSLDRMKAAVERRKKGLDDSVTTVSERVEGTRVNPDSLISELLANTELLESGESMFDRKLRKLWIFKTMNVDYCLMAISAWHYSDGTATVHFERRHDIIGRSRGEKHGWISIQKSCDGKSEIVACTRQQ